MRDPQPYVIEMKHGFYSDWSP